MFGLLSKIEKNRLKKAKDNAIQVNKDMRTKITKRWEKTKNNKTEQPNVIVFTNTKDGAEQYGKALANLANRFYSKNKKSSSGIVRVIHGDK